MYIQSYSDDDDDDDDDDVTTSATHCHHDVIYTTYTAVNIYLLAGDDVSSQL